MSTTTRATEPRGVCGRETRSGSPLFSDRRSMVDEDGSRTQCCGERNERAVAPAARGDSIEMVQLSARAAGMGAVAHPGAGAVI